MSRAEPGVSVLLPVYMTDPGVDAVRALDHALQSVLVQETPGPLEVVVIDDGSPAPVRELIPAHANNPKIRWMRSPHNSGLVDALNRGLASGQHELVARIDADDAWEPGKLAKQVALFQADADLTVVGTGMTRINPDGRVIDRHVRSGDWAGILRFLVEVGCPFPHGSVVASRRTFQALGGYAPDPEVRHCEDFELWGRWLRFFKPAMIEEALYRYTVTESSVSGQNTRVQSQAAGRIQQQFRDLDIAGTLPDHLAALAQSLGASLVSAGELALTVWRQPVPVALPEAVVAPLQAVLPDRDVRPAETASKVWSPAALIPELTATIPGRPYIAWPVA
jgi:glycosyltransferase involved in cell wall biosynthesis